MNYAIDFPAVPMLPVAESNRVRLACHPHDPYTPPGYKGVKKLPKLLPPVPPKPIPCPKAQDANEYL